MKKSLQYALILVGLSLLLSPQDVRAQFGYSYSEIGYSSGARYVYGYSETWIDYDLYAYYDPAVRSELFRGDNNEFALDGGYSQGADQSIGAGYAATVSTFAGSHYYRASTLYYVYSTHFIIPVYYYSPTHCYGYGFTGNCYTDPWGLGFLAGGGLFGGYYDFPGSFFNPYRYLAYRTKILARLYVPITTSSEYVPLPPPPPGSCSNGDGGASANFASTATTTNTCASPQYQITIGIDPGDLRPAGTTGGQNNATVTVQISPPLANKTVRLRLESVPQYTGGHVDAQHSGERPLGRLRQTQGVTNASGTLRIAYTPSHIAGYVKVIATIEGADLGAIVKVKVPDLNALGAGENYRLIGATTSHPDNHYGTTAANNGLVQIANDYKNAYYPDTPGPNPIPNPIPDADKLAYNDQSLEFGGKFELANRWAAAGSHAEHREGINCDVRSNNVPNARRARLNDIFRERGSTRTNDETGTSAPHWHLRFEFNNQQAAVVRNIGNFVEGSFWGSLDREANYAEWQDWTNKLTNAQAQGQSPMLADTRGYVRSLFKSTEYVNRSRSDADYVTDLYWGYLLREPDPGGYNTWINALQNYNAQGLDGRELVLQGFEYSTEFANLVAALERVPEEPPPPPPPPCTDNDGDGYCSSQDCNDYDSSVYPGAGTYCSSGEDRNCNGQDDYSECYGCGVYGCY
jgi:hypothetical protein